MRVEDINISKFISHVGLVSLAFIASYAILEPAKGLLLIGIPFLVFFFIKPIFALIAFIFLIPFEASLIGIDDFISFFKILGIVVAICYFVNKTVSMQFPSVGKIPHIKLMLIFLLLMFISAIFSTDQTMSLIQYLTYVQLFFFYVIVIDFIDNERKFKYVISALLLAGMISAIYSIYNYYFESGTVFASDIRREAGFLENANRFGYLQTLIALLAFPHAMNIKNKIIRFIYIFAIAVLIFSSILSFSRGAVIALIATSLYVLTVLFKQKKIVIVLIAILAVIAILAPSTFWERTKTIIFPDEIEGSRQTRVAFLVDGFKMGLSAPVTGVGLGRFKEEFLKFSRRTVSPTAGGAHNMYVSIMAENGIPVLAAFLILLYRTLRKTRNYGRSSPRELTNYAIGIELGMVFTLCAGIFATIEYSKIFWLLLALANVPDKIGCSLDSNMQLKTHQRSLI